MRTLGALAACAVAAANAAATGGSLCFPAPQDATCLAWVVGAENITLTATFPADPSQGAPVWGAWGLPALACGNMWPAHVWLALPAPDGSVRIEDRVATGHAAPACAARAPQLSHTLSGAVAADGSATVTWTRPLAPAPAFQQPALAPGPTPLIGAFALGAGALAFPACATAGLPFHTAVLNGVAADFLPAAAAPTPALAARYSGLAALVAVCGDACAAVAHLSPATGRLVFPTAASPPLFPLLTALDAAGRVLHVLAFDNSNSPTPLYPSRRSAALFVASLSADTGALLGTCPTPFALNDGFDYANLNFAFDAARGEVLIASCTDGSCVAPLNVTALAPGSCAARSVAALAVEELTVGGSGAIDPYARVLVLSFARGGARPGLVLLALNISTGAPVHITSESQDAPYVQSLVFCEASRLVYGLAFTTDGASQPQLVAIDARTGKVRTVGPVPGCGGALPASLAASADGSRLYFIGVPAGSSAPTIFAIHAENATVASAAPLQGALSLGDAPSALFWMP
jgi:hypothetical protein